MMSVQVVLAHRSDLKAAEAFLRKSNLKVTDIPDVGIIAATGTVRAMESAFAVRMGTWQSKTTHRSFFANDRPATLPFPVTGIFGLDTAAQPVSLAHAKLRCPLICPGYGVDQVRKAYNFTLPNNDGRGQNVAIFAHNGFDQNDINAFSDDQHLAAITPVVREYGAIDPLTVGPDDTGRFPPLGSPLPAMASEVETTIDIESVHAFAPQAGIHVYEMSQATDAISAFLVAAAAQGENILSISSGVCESDLGSNAHRYAELTALVVRRNRMSIFAASGDRGTQCFSQVAGDVQTGLTWPGSDPSVTSVGGTQLDLNGDDTLQQESAWDESDAGASGGGESYYFRRPQWQQGILPEKRNRIVPDVAANAAAEGSLGFTVNGKRQQVAGTSQGAPLWAAVAALYNQYAKDPPNVAPTLGPANELLYRLDKGDRPLFDVTTTQNHGKDLAGVATAGWDLATGLGTPNVAVLIRKGVAAMLKAQPSTDVLTFQPWVAGPGVAGLSVPLPGLSFNGVTGYCDSGSADDPGRAAAFRCYSPGGDVGNGTPCFADTLSGDPGSPLLCFSDPTSHRAVRLTQVGGAQLPLQLANVDDPAAPPWFLILANAHSCRLNGYGTNVKDFPYDCGNGVRGSLPDRTTRMWTVSELSPTGAGAPGPRIEVLRAIF